MTDYEMTAIIEAQRERQRRELLDAMRRVDRVIADWLRWMASKERRQ